MNFLATFIFIYVLIVFVASLLCIAFCAIYFFFIKYNFCFDQQTFDVLILKKKDFSVVVVVDDDSMDLLFCVGLSLVSL